MEFGKKEINQIKKGLESKPAVVPTDTIYGIIASALDKKAVLNLYKIRQRDKGKPFIILISSIKDLELFNIELDKNQLSYLKKIWPSKVTVILKCKEKRMQYLHRGSKALAFRIPDKDWLRSLIRKIGPIVAPSANIEGKKEARNIKEAYGYFGDKAIYFDGGRLGSASSTIISLVDGQFKIIRKGSYRIKKNEYFRPSINN
jgi:L-threonylcarbamoyladenylate synthase